MSDIHDVPVGGPVLETFSDCLLEIGRLNDEAKKREAEIERLEDLMERYGRHLDWCVHAPHDTFCKCGFLTALQKCNKKKKEEE